MKTFIYIQLALFISSIVSCNSRDEDVVIYYHYDKNKKEAEVIAGEKKYSGDLVIPSTTTLNDTVYLVTRIGKSAFDFCTDLTSVEIPGSVTYIGVRAFADCRQLTTIEIPNSVKYIAEQAFQRCKGLTSATLPNKLKSINCVTFNECVHLASIEIPQSVTSIEDFAFGACKNLTNVYCYAEQVPETNNAFTYSNYTNATLHVPAISIDAYKNAEQWKDFGNIVALTDPSGIEATRATQEPTIVERYTIDGKRIVTPQRGLNIIKMSDGTTKKVVVK